MDGKILAERLLAYARANLHMRAEDETYARNALLTFLRLPSPGVPEADYAVPDSPDELAEQLSAYALENGLCAEGEEERFWVDIFGALTPLPSVVNDEFARIR